MILGVIIGAACVVIATALMAMKNRLLARYTRATGTVTELVRRGRGLAPVVHFKDHQGRPQAWTSPVSTNPPAARVGDAVEILYDPSNPTRAAIDTFFQKHLVSFILALTGSINIIVFGVLAAVL